ncbi:MAG TPA: hypothetical protein VHC22_24135 [Pirellulales bacterium]|nr:hypothetical protein [Pirellulales bacterium]
MPFRLHKVQHLLDRGPTTHFSFQAVENEAAVAAVQEIDAMLDRRWFERHPLVTSRVRKASPRERVAYGLAAGSRMLVNFDGHFVTASLYTRDADDATSDPSRLPLGPTVVAIITGDLPSA